MQSLIRMESLVFRENGFEIHYPQIVSGSTIEKINLWNQIIIQDINQIIELYSYRPFPELEPDLVGQITLRLVYESHLLNDRYLSIFYKASYFNPYSPYPSELVYTTNIDLYKDRRIRLSDIVNVNQEFINQFRQWEFIPLEESNEEVNLAIRDYFNQISDEALFQGFMAADQIGSENTMGVFTYLKPGRLGISMEAPNYIGGHVEFEGDFMLN